MSDLEDYSGEFKPDLNLTDFSKEALVRLLVAASKMYLGADGMWTTVIRKRYGDDVALSCSKEVWDTNWKQEMRRPTEAMNIHGNDIASMFKYFQIDPGFAVMFDIDYELKDDGKYGLMTVTKCRTTARAFNPKIKTTILKMPPRKNKDEIPCQWEFKLEE